ncbi:hypothetical protein OG749_37625 [Streptomyces nojiriensis]|uniref:hypothetical protein n=1 Tax=Streptomyces nojiriensis TaxID=66374 RepID=UPI002E16D361
MRAGETGAAAALVEELRPFAGEVRFAPHPADRPLPRAAAVDVRTVGEVAGALARYRRPAAAHTRCAKHLDPAGRRTTTWPPSCCAGSPRST